VAGNSIPFGNDMTGLFPRYINIRRGQLLCAVLGWAICPWLLQAKAARFFAFLNGYTVFLGPLMGVLLADYWLVRRRKGGLNVYQLYRPGGLYWFIGGVNPRALAALLTGMAPLLPGLIHNINPAISVSRGIQAFYTLSWLDGLVLSGLSYYLLYLAFPFPANVEESGVVYDAETPSGSESPDGSSRVDMEKSVKPEGNYI
jgi:nucleobase:cation symporter-1, NCS1 family